MTMLGLRYDLRAPAFAGVTHAELYAACLDQCAWAEAHGFDVVALSEHHGVDDGYLSAPVTLAAAIAGRTKRLQINIAAVLVPLHDPVRLAEQLAVVQLVSGGRLSLVAGLGYRDEEFQMAGVDRRQRGRLLEEYVGVMRQAWSGEPFEWRGRTVRATPVPPSPPMVLIGGSTEKAARRAARLHAGFFPAIADAALAAAYEEECARQGFTGFVVMPGGPGFVHVSNDPERDWARIAPHALYDARTYAAWQPPGQRSQVHVAGNTLDELRRSGVYRVVTPDECVALAEEYGRVLLHPLMGGLSPTLAWESLELFERAVLARLKAAS
jgi:alkanesulfonate monooxygenase SsuD/methylene tetrahydromethanopterin reductase-like flavin-dependent oxidoreductase (luciferase family)